MIKYGYVLSALALLALPKCSDPAPSPEAATVGELAVRDCIPCEEIKAGDGKCYKTGKKMCPNGACFWDTSNCLCTPSCRLCTQICTPLGECIASDYVYCNDGSCRKPADCASNCNDGKGCAACTERCEGGKCIASGSKICADKSCVPNDWVCGVMCGNGCQPCIEACYQNANDTDPPTCTSTGKVLCPSNIGPACVWYDEKCPVYL